VHNIYFFIGSVCISTTSILPPEHRCHWSSPSHATNCWSLVLYTRKLSV